MLQDLRQQLKQAHADYAHLEEGEEAAEQRMAWSEGQRAHLRDRCEDLEKSVASLRTSSEEAQQQADAAKERVDAAEAAGRAALVDAERKVQ